MPAEKAESTSVLIVGDLHVGSLNAPMSDDINITDSLSNETLKYNPSHLQKYLYENFAKLAYSKPWDYVVVNGDVCAGCNKGDEGRYVWSADLAFQAEAATQMLKKIDCGKMFFTMGTPYHSESDRPLEQIVAEKLQVYGIKTEFSYDLLCQIMNWNIHFGHCMDWKGSVVDAIGRELGTLGADLVVRSHRHEYAYVEKGKRKGVVTPCWEWRTPYGIVNGMYSGTDIGMTDLLITEEAIHVNIHLVDMKQFIPKKVL